MTQQNVEWPTCVELDCIGIQLASGDRCLAHGSDDERYAALQDIQRTGEIDARGIQFKDGLLEQVLDAAPRNPAGRPFIKSGRFKQAVFDRADFTGSTFSGIAVFNDVRFQGDVTFAGTTFSGNVSFRKAQFCGNAGFQGAMFSNEASFAGVKYRGEARFSAATFGGNTVFEDAEFRDEASFRGVTFGDDVWFARAVFRERAGFANTRFEKTSNFGPILTHRDLMLDWAHFMERIQIEAGAAVVSCVRARFPGGVQFRLQWAQVNLDDADFPEPSTLTGSRIGMLPVFEDRPALSSFEEHRMATDIAWGTLLIPETPSRPQVVSLRGANVAGLALKNVTLTDCRFAGAHNLDKLRLEDDVTLPTAPTPLGRLSWDRRRVIAEERAWRASRYQRWQAPWWPGWLDRQPHVRGPEVLDPGQIAALYRALRKGREDNKDEPGAADFYYGEMEMRRHAGSGANNSVSGSSRGWAERALLTVYWMVSGYGLRAWRALAWLLGTVAVFTVLFHWFGFRTSVQPESYWQSLLITLETALSLEDKNAGLTGWGRLFRVLLRIAGPLLLGLAVLALRGRVKR